MTVLKVEDWDEAKTLAEILLYNNKVSEVNIKAEGYTTALGGVRVLYSVEWEDKNNEVSKIKDQEAEDLLDLG